MVVALDEDERDRHREEVDGRDPQESSPQVATRPGRVAPGRGRDEVRPREQEAGEHEEDRDADVEPREEAADDAVPPVVAGGEEDMRRQHRDRPDGTKCVEHREPTRGRRRRRHELFGPALDGLRPVQSGPSVVAAAGAPGRGTSTLVTRATLSHAGRRHGGRRILRPAEVVPRLCCDDLHTTLLMG
jgi:hypothetical protein